MARRARRPLLPQLIWGPQKRIYRRSGQVTVMRVPAHSTLSRQLVEDFCLAAGVSFGLVVYVIIGNAL